MVTSIEFFLQKHFKTNQLDGHATNEACSHNLQFIWKHAHSQYLNQVNNQQELDDSAIDLGETSNVPLIMAENMQVEIIRQNVKVDRSSSRDDDACLRENNMNFVACYIEDGKQWIDKICQEK